MRRRAVLVAAVALLVQAEAAPAEPGIVVRPPVARTLPRRPYPLGPFFRPPRYRPVPPAPRLLPPPPPGRFRQPLPPEPPRGEEPMLPPLGHGFRLTVPVGGKATFAVPATLSRYVDVGQALGACFSPPAGTTWGAITLRVAFRRDGSVFGEPRVPFSDARTPEQKSELARSLLGALKRCAPLHLSASLGGAIAGEIFAIRFVNQDRP